MIEKINPHYSMENPATVYDEESLTVLQLVGRTTHKLNEVVGDQNDLRDHMEKVETEDIPAKIDAEINRRIVTGQFASEIDHYVGDLGIQYENAVDRLGAEYRESVAEMDNRLDNLLGSVTEGSTTGDVELIDARLTHNNETFASAGEAIRNGDNMNTVNATMIEKLNREKRMNLPGEYFEKGSLLANGSPDTFAEGMRARSKYTWVFPFDVWVSVHSQGEYRHPLNGERLTCMAKFKVVMPETETTSEWTQGFRVPAFTRFKLILTLNENITSVTWDVPLETIMDDTFRISAETADSDLFKTGVHSLPEKIMEYGMIDDAGNNGNVIDETGHKVRTRTPIKLEHDLTIYPPECECNGCYIVYTLGEDGVYENTGWIKTPTTIPAGTTFRMYFGPLTKTINITIPVKPVDMVDIIGGYKYRYGESVSDRNREAVANIAGAKMHFDLENKDSFSRHSRTTCTTIAHISDIHCDEARLRNFLEFVKSNKDQIGVAICTGDFVNDPTDANQWDRIQKVIDESGVDLLRVAGNHERTGGSTTLTTEEMIETFDVGYFSTYLNDALTKLIVLNQFEGDGGEMCFSQTQIDWFINELYECAMDDYAVVIAMHYTDDFPGSNDKGFYQRYRPWVFSSSHDNSEPIIEEIVQAFIDGEVLNRSFHFKKTNTTVTVNYDTDGEKGVFLGYMTGHWHGDYCGYLENYPDQLCLNVTTGCLSSDWTDKNYGEEASDLPRIPHTKSEDAFNVYGFDAINRIVKVVRVGSDVNDIMEDRKKTVFTI